LRLEGGFTPEALSITQSNRDTIINFESETLAVLMSVDSSDLMAANPFLVA